MTALVHVLRLGGDDTVALCGAPWPPLTAERDAPVCGACFRSVMAVVDARPTLAERQARYLEVRQHTLSTAGMAYEDAVVAEADYVLGEARELQAAATDLALDGVVVDVDDRTLTTEELLTAVRHEIADVVLAAATFAGILGVTVEACIDEKTEADRGRG